MKELGVMGVDYEERINFDRMRKYRLQRVKDAMKNQGVEALLVTGGDHIRYISGWRMLASPNGGRPGMPSAVLTIDGAPVFRTSGREDCSSVAGDKAGLRWVREVMPWLPPENIRMYLTLDDIRDVLGKHAAGVIGIDAWSPQMLQALPAAFPKAKFVDGGKVMDEAQLIKNQDELACIKVANAITEAGMESLLEALKPGVRECELLGEVQRTMTRLGSESFQTSGIVSSGPYTYPYRKLCSDRILRRGDLVIVDIGGCFNGYYGDITRTWVCGDAKPSKEQIDLHQNVYNALFNSIALARPGNTTADLVRAAEPYITDDNLLAHGSSVTVFTSPVITRDSLKNPLTLRAGMEFNIEPYGGKPGVGGFRLENQVIVTEGDPDIFSSFPFDAKLLKEVHQLDATTARR